MGANARVHEGKSKCARTPVHAPTTRADARGRSALELRLVCDDGDHRVRFEQRPDRPQVLYERPVRVHRHVHTHVCVRACVRVRACVCVYVST